MNITPISVLRRAVIPCLDERGAFHSVYGHDGDIGVFSGFKLDNGKDMYIFFRDLSKRMANIEMLRMSEGFKVSIPRVADFPAGFDAARMVNELNSAPSMIGAFTADEYYGWLGFTLETIVPKNSASPEHVKIAIGITVNAAMWLHDVVKVIDLTADDWDIEDILSVLPFARD